MRTRKQFIPVLVVLVLVAALLVDLKTSIKNPRIVQASSKEASETGKITDRRAFMEGVFFVQDMRTRALSSGRDKLAGLECVEVLAEAVHPCAGRHGLTEQLLQTDTELRLRMHGIIVGTEVQPQRKKSGKCDSAAIHSSIENWRQAIAAESEDDFLQFAREKVRSDLFDTARPATLYINLATIVFEESGRATFSLRVELKEMAYLSRNGAFCSAPVWHTGNVGACPSDRLKEYVRECLRDHVDEFINDYLAANPKDRSSESEP